MFDSILSKIAAVIFTPLLAISAWFTPAPELSPAVGTALPEAVAIFETSLASPITANATTMTLTSNSIRGGGSLSGFNCFTIDEGSAQAEFVCGTVATTTVTGLTRGISPADGVTEDTDLQFSHRRGANVKITDFPIIQRLKLQNNGEGTFENALSYATGVTPTGNSHLTDVEYVLSVVNGGTVSFDNQIVTGNAGATIATGTVVYRNLSDGEWYAADADVTGHYTDRLIGITQGAGTDGNAITGGILISGIDRNQSGLSANSLYFLSSTAGGVQTATSSQIIGVAISTTELILAPYILDTYNPYSATYTGNNTFSGSSTFSGTSSFSATTTFSGPITGHASTTYNVYTASTTWSKPDGLEYIEVWVCGGGGGGGSNAGDTSDGGGGGGGCAFEHLSALELAATTSVQIIVGSGGSAQTSGGSSSFGDFLSATGGSGATDQIGGAGGTGSNGDLNITGGGGVSIPPNSSGGAAGGTGGSSHFGGGGVGTVGTNGNPGGSYGGGGGGSASTDSTSYTGGAGAQGFVSIKEYF